MTVSMKDVNDIMLCIDMNHNGSIDYTEFLASCMRSKIYLKEDLLRTAFEYFDKVRLIQFDIIVGLEWKNNI